MLMDEPFGAVDPIVREHLQDEFLRLHQTLGMTVMLVTHDIDEAIKMGRRVAVMRQGGYLEQYAPPAELLAHPASEFVAQFVGADRALKHLALLTVSDLAPVPFAELVDGRGGGVPDNWPRFDGDTLLRDALSELLVADEHVGVILGADGAVLGGITLGSIGAALARDAHASQADAPAQRSE
jgi:osmoprotectant transport system ATP-binding protein